MPAQPLDLWQRFSESLAAQLERTAHAELAFSWASSARRTRFYATDLLARVAHELGLTLQRERLLVDYALCTPVDDVPLVFIESENDPCLADQEIWKLSALASPVRVLISVAQWDETPAVWASGGCRTERLARWRAIAESFSHAYGGLAGIVAAVIGEWRPDDVFRLYAYQIAGESWTDAAAEVVFEQRMTVKQPFLTEGG